MNDFNYENYQPGVLNFKHNPMCPVTPTLYISFTASLLQPHEDDDCPLPGQLEPDYYNNASFLGIANFSLNKLNIGKLNLTVKQPIRPR